MNERDRSFVIRIVLVVLAISTLSVIFVLELGLFTDKVDNKQVFEILTPLSQQISGALISILSGMIAYKAGTKDGS